MAKYQLYITVLPHYNRCICLTALDRWFVLNWPSLFPFPPFHKKLLFVGLCVCACACAHEHVCVCVSTPLE